jgi:hypothetical protein
MESAFEPWIGQLVVVQLTLGRIKLSLLGTLLKDQSETLSVKLEAGCEVEIPKTYVLAIEQPRRCCTRWHTFLPSGIRQSKRLTHLNNIGIGKIG